MGQILPTYQLPDSTHSCPEPIRQLEPGYGTNAEPSGEVNEQECQSSSEPCRRQERQGQTRKRVGVAARRAQWGLRTACARERTPRTSDQLPPMPGMAVC